MVGRSTHWVRSNSVLPLHTDSCFMTARTLFEAQTLDLVRQTQLWHVEVFQVLRHARIREHGTCDGESTNYRPSVEKLYNRPGFIEHNPGNAGWEFIHFHPGRF